MKTDQNAPINNKVTIIILEGKRACLYIHISLY